REGVPMKLVEEPRSPRLALRAEVRAVIDRLQAGEVIPRRVSVLTADRRSDEGIAGENGGVPPGSNRRPPRQVYRQESNRPDRRETSPAAAAAAAPTNAPPSAPPPPTATPPEHPDGFAAGLTDDEPASPS